MSDVLSNQSSGTGIFNPSFINAREVCVCTAISTDRTLSCRVDGSPALRCFLGCQLLSRNRIRRFSWTINLSAKNIDRPARFPRSTGEYRPAAVSITVVYQKCQHVLPARAVPAIRAIDQAYLQRHCSYVCSGKSELGVSMPRQRGSTRGYTKSWGFVPRSGERFNFGR